MAKATLIDLMTEREYEIPEDKNEVKVGRDKDNYIVLPDRAYLKSLNDAIKKNDFLGLVKKISRKHCIIHRKGEDFVIIDTNSSNGVYVNGDKIEPEKGYSLKNGTEINLGRKYKLKFIIEKEEKTKVIEEPKKEGGLDDFKFDIDGDDSYTITDEDLK